MDHQQIQFITEIKEKVRAAQYEALKAVNVRLINLYWDLGKAISEKQTLGWGKSIVPKIARELQKEFPSMSGFSTTNLWYMVGRSARFDPPSPGQPDHLIKLFANSIRWSTKTSGRWSDTPFCPGSTEFGKNNQLVS